MDAATVLLRPLLNSLLYHPSCTVAETPASAGLEYEELGVRTDDGEHLQGWWIRARTRPRGHVLLCHGNAGNIGDRIVHAALLAAAGFDVLLFDYRGYGNSSGSPGEEGTYSDARAALGCLLGRRGVDAERVVFLGESLGGAVALQLAIERPPAGLVLLSAFSGIRALGRVHYPMIPAALVPDAYPSLRRIARLRAPLLVLHGDRDGVVPVAHAQALFDAAPEPKRLRIFPGLAHNDLIAVAGAEIVREVARWVRQDGAG